MRQNVIFGMQEMILFQSTHPMRGATPRPVQRSSALDNFNPRTPCGVRHAFAGGQIDRILISIHAPHAGCDSATWLPLMSRMIFQSTHPMRGATLKNNAEPLCTHPFQSTHPMRGATYAGAKGIHLKGISIHAPHAGCDPRPADWPEGFPSISIHAPHAGCDAFKK